MDPTDELSSDDSDSPWGTKSETSCDKMGGLWGSIWENFPHWQSDRADGWSMYWPSNGICNSWRLIFCLSSHKVAPFRFFFLAVCFRFLDGEAALDWDDFDFCDQKHVSFDSLSNKKWIDHWWCCWTSWISVITHHLQSKHAWPWILRSLINKNKLIILITTWRFRLPGQERPLHSGESWQPELLLALHRPNQNNVNSTC